MNLIHACARRPPSADKVGDVGRMTDSRLKGVAQPANPAKVRALGRCHAGPGLQLSGMHSSFSPTP